MYNLSKKQTEKILLIKINEIEMSEDFTEKDKIIMKRFYNNKIVALNGNHIKSAKK
jgi:hypothetical protein